jgi:O-antigen/teichoic acid export membrane protein
MTSTDSGPRVFEPGTEPGARSWRDRISLRGQDDKIMRNSILLMACSAAMGLFGFAFWLIVARLYDPEQIGTASSLISAIILISYLSLIGLDVTVVRFAGKFADRNAVTTTAMTLIIVVSLVLSVLYAQYAPAYAPELAFVRDDIWFKLAFYAICVLAAVNLFSDSVFLAALRPEFNLYTDGFIQGVFKIAAPFALVGMGAAGIVMATGIGYAMSVIAGLVFMWRWLSMRPAWQRRQSDLHRFWGFSGSAYVANVLNTAPLMLLPIIALHGLGAEQAGYYFIAFQIANLVNAVSYAVAQAAFSEASQETKNVMPLIKKSARIMFGVLVPVILVSIILGDWILRIIGSEYASNATGVLRLLLLGCLAVAANSMSAYVLKLANRMSTWIVANAIGCVVILGFAQVFVSQGLEWVAFAWILGNAAAAIVGLAPFVFRRNREFAGG